MLVGVRLQCRSSQKMSNYVTAALFLVITSCVVLFLLSREAIDDDRATYYSAFCHCNRSVPSRSSVRLPTIHWCNEETTWRGFHQNVVAFSLYGPADEGNRTSRYFTVLDQIAQQVGRYYPEWRIRIYHTISSRESREHRTICDLYCRNDNVDLCDVGEIYHSLSDSDMSSTDLPVLPKEVANMNRMNWRLLPLIDPLVDRWMSRDTDAEVNDREAAAVHQWLESDKTFHIMRDHPAHSQPIMGGMFGAKVLERRDLLQVLARAAVWMGSREGYGLDQQLLARLFWPRVKDDAIIHDSYHCAMNWYSAPITPFPTRRWPITTFVSDRLGSEWPRPSKCPTACRPPHHKNWEYC